MQGKCVACVCRSRGIEHDRSESLFVAGIGQPLADLSWPRCWEIARGTRARPWRTAGQLGSMIGKIKERARGREFLTLKQHRNAGHQQQERRHRAPAARARQRVQALAGDRIGDLVVVLQKDDERLGRQVERRRAARLLLPVVALALIKKAVFGRAR